MERYQRSLYVDVAAFVALVPAVISGVVLWVSLPGGGNRGATVWTLTRGAWIDVHVWTSVALVALVVGHLLLHLTYIANVPRMLRQGRRRRNR